MRTMVILIAFVLIALGAARAQSDITNRTSRAEAIRIASRLKVGMGEKNVRNSLAEHGLTNNIALGALTGWSRFYTLADGCNLVLEYTSRPMPTKKWWEGDGLLERAFIQSNGIHIVSITLTNAP